MPKLRQIIYRNIEDHHTETICETVFNRRNGGSKYSAETEEMIADWSEMAGRKGQRVIDLQKQVVNGTSVDTMSDEEMERVIIRLRTATEPDQRVINPETAQATSRELEAFKKYKHHQFVRRWGLFSDAEGLDEEWFLADPPILLEGDVEFLCEMCRHIDFRVLFSKRGLPGNQAPGQSGIRIFGLSNVMANSSCSFCTLLRQKIVQDDLLESLSEEQVEDGSFQLNILDEGPTAAVRLEVELADIDQERNRPRFVIQVIDEESNVPLQGLHVSRDVANIAKLKEWIYQCNDLHHSTQPDHKPFLEHESTALRLIDVEDYCVRVVANPSEYACLSYVWGNGNQVQYTTHTMEMMNKADGLRDASVKLPQTIKDAIEVVQSVGLRYIWIDALCIIQDDDNDKDAIIKNMHTIYGNAALTIIASTNSDPMEGIPGVSKRRSEGQITSKVQGMTLGVVMQDFRKRCSEIENSKWNSRAWTFQERLLSRCSVYFTESQMCFECSHSIMFEDTVPVRDVNYRPLPLNEQTKFASRLYDLWTRVWADPTQAKYPNKAFALGGTTMVMVAEDLDAPDQCNQEPAPVYEFTDAANDGAMYKHLGSGGTMWDMYRRSVNAYTKREMSWQSDALNAYLGVTDLIRQGTNTTFWYGMPEFAFHESLLWQPQEPLKRRLQAGKPLFPSWAWAAWEGHVSYRGRGWHNAIQYPPVCVLRWFEALDPQEFFEQWEAAEEHSNEEVDSMMQQLRNINAVMQEYNSLNLMHCNDKQFGWELHVDEERNQHIYSHDAYPGIEFNYPICLPGQQIIDRRDKEGILHIKGRTVGARFVDMADIQPVPTLSQDPFLQIGLKDEARSANRRRPWQHIIYHQGYRAGFLSLNIPYESLNPGDDTYTFIAVSRDSLPQIEGPEINWKFYRETDPRTMQREIFFEELEATVETFRKPKETAVAITQPRNENGDPYWDEGRFGNVSIFDVYNVLLLRTVEGFSERIGVGKVSFVAFNDASPETLLLKLR
jgi:hypothetical protein